MIFSDLNTLARQGGFTILQNGGATLLQDVIAAKGIMAQTLPIFTTPAPTPAADPGSSSTAGGTTSTPPPATVLVDPGPPAVYYRPPPDYNQMLAQSLTPPWYQSPMVAAVGVGLVAIFYLQHRGSAKPMAGYRKRRRR